MAIPEHQVFILNINFAWFESILVPLIKSFHLDKLALLIPIICELPETCVTLLIKLAVKPNLIQSLEFPLIDTLFNAIIEHLDSKCSSLPMIDPLKESLLSFQLLSCPIKLNGGDLKLGQLVVSETLQLSH